MKPEHGTRVTYWKGCRCKACTRANTLYIREYRSRAGKKAGWPVSRGTTTGQLVAMHLEAEAEP